MCEFGLFVRAELSTNLISRRRFAAGFLCGVVGSLAANPFDLIRVRQQVRIGRDLSTRHCSNSLRRSPWPWKE